MTNLKIMVSRHYSLILTLVLFIGVKNDFMSILASIIPEACPGYVDHKVHSTIHPGCWILSGWWPKVITWHPSGPSEKIYQDHWAKSLPVFTWLSSLVRYCITLFRKEIEKQVTVWKKHYIENQGHLVLIQS